MAMRFRFQIGSFNFMPTINASSVCRLMAVATFVLLAAQIRVSADILTVNTVLDNEANGCGIGNCTLREAVNQANSASGDDTILFQPNLSGIIVLTTFLHVTSNITIMGPGPRSLSVSCASNRVFIVSGASVNATISGLTITGNGLGGGVGNSSGATLNLFEVALTNNRSGVGAGVSTRDGAITNITRSLISNNVATAGGGGIDVQTPSIVTVTNSTITGNTAVNDAGGIGNLGGTVNLINVTVSHNSVTGGVGQGSGIGNFNAGTINIRNSLSTHNTSATGIPSDVSGFPFTSFGGNVIPECNAYVGPFGNPNSFGDRIGSSRTFPPVIINTLLGPLQNNGGQTDTRLLAEGSPAIDFGGNCVVTASCAGLNPPLALSTDQRGETFQRRNGSRVDSGAFEAFSTSVLRTTLYDFDGDSKTDISIFRPSAGEWWIDRSFNGETFAAQFGNSSDKPTPADFTGDGKTDISIWRPSTGQWFVLRSDDFSYYSVPFGLAGDVPAPSDYDGDARADVAVFRPSSATWYISRSTGGTTIQQFGADSDAPVPGDYDGDSKSDIAIWRAAAGQWWIQRSSNSSVIAYQFGSQTDKPVQGDYTGDGKADVTIFRPSSGEWFILRSEDLSYYSFPFGTSGDIPVPGDYDGDGKFDVAVFRPASTDWFIERTTAGTLIKRFGSTGDVPVPSAFVP
jgi:hypothetical protein